MATTLTMNVDRNVVALPMPTAGGSRFAFDLNLPKSLITIEGVMTDDDLLSIGDLQREANAIIDFSRIQGESADSAFRWNFYVSTFTNGVTLDNPSTAKYAIKINNTYEIWLAKQTSSFFGYDSGSSRYYLATESASAYRTVTQIASDFAGLINANSGTFNMTANVINSPTDNTANVAVELTQTNQGKAGNMSHPSFSTWPVNALLPNYKPYHTQFFGGTNSVSAENKSAGDKVAELFGVLNNSNNGGGGAILNPDAWLRSLNDLADKTSIISGNERQNLDAKYGDYIIGIQIPFKSNVNNNSSLFYMPTGGLMEIFDKTADNAKPVGTKYQGIGDEYGAIKGAIANATFVQLGGEPLYSYTINFIPIDWIF